MPILTRPRLFTVLLLAGITACNVIPARPGAEHIAVAEESALSACERKGATTVSVLHRAGFVERTDAAIADDLARLAANDAVDLGGDTMAPLGPVSEGKRKFAIYKCRPGERR